MMLKLYKILIIFIAAWCGVFDVFAETIYFDIAGINRTWSEDTIILDGVNVQPKNLTITNSIFIQNNGNFIPNNTYIGDGCSVYVENKGSIESVFEMGTNAQLFQVVSGQESLRAAEFGVEYTIVAKSDEVLSLADVIDFTNDATSIVFEDITLSLDKVPQNTNARVVFGENVELIVDDNPEIYNKVLLDNISGDVLVRFITGTKDVMYSDVGYLRYGSLYVERTRQTDYEVIFSDSNKGKFINQLRESSKNNNLLYLLDNATDMTELENVMSKSVLFNPNQLIMPLQIINTLSTLNSFAENDSDSDVNAFVFGIMSDNFTSYGADISLVNLIEDEFNFNVGLNIGQVLYSSDIEEYDMMFYGFDLGAKYTFENNLFVSGKLGYGIADFDIDAVFVKDKIVNSPKSTFGTFVLDAGYDFSINDSINLSSFVGLRTDFYKLDDCSLSEFAARLGVSVGYLYELSEMKYRYDFGLVADTENLMAATANISFISPTDGMGLGVGISVANVFDTVAYKAMVSINIAF